MVFGRRAIALEPLEDVARALDDGLVEAVGVGGRLDRVEVGQQRALIAPGVAREVPPAERRHRVLLLDVNQSVLVVLRTRAGHVVRPRVDDVQELNGSEKFGTVFDVENPQVVEIRRFKLLEQLQILVAVKEKHRIQLNFREH